MSYVSEYTTKKKKELEDIEKTKPGAYQSQYGDRIGSLLSEITNRKPFTYDFNADALYNQYKDNYVQQGKQAMMNATANAAGLTGGYGNSYATVAGAQANQQHLSQLNAIIPELYSAAMDKYNMDTNNLMNQYGIVTDAESKDYSRYQDALANYNANRDYLYGQYMDAIGQDQYREQFDYTKAQDAQAYQQWLEQFNYNKAQDDRAYQQWLEQFNYTKEQDALDRAAAEQALARVRSSSGSSGNSGGNSQDDNEGPSNASPLVDTAVEANKIAESKTPEDAAEYLAQQVNAGIITQEQAINIYNNIAPKEEKKGTVGTSSKLNNKKHLKDVSLK